MNKLAVLHRGIEDPGRLSKEDLLILEKMLEMKLEETRKLLMRLRQRKQ